MNKAMLQLFDVLLWLLLNVIQECVIAGNVLGRIS